MFIPYATDAPVYHFPWATIGLIVTNTLVFGLVRGGGISEDFLIDHLILWHGEGFHPTQWIGSNFMHGDILHLVGNMVFLWVFGLVIEGKIGWWRFLIVYLGIGILQCALEQAAMLWNSGLEQYSFGASAIIFGLLGMAMIWAPQNDVRFFYWIWIRPGLGTATMKTVGVLYLLLEVVLAVLEVSGGGIGSSMLHLSGAAVGIPLAIVMVKRDWVDCEGWDWFSLRDGRPGEIRLHREHYADDEVADEDTEETEAQSTEERETSLELLRDSLAEGDVEAALAIHETTESDTGPWELPDDVVLDLVKKLRKAQLWDPLKPWLHIAIERFPARRAQLSLVLAQIYIQVEERPARGLEVLGELAPEALSPQNRRIFDTLKRRAEELRASGVIELDLED